MRIYAFSDPHGFTDILKEALNKAGFESGNPEHLLVGCGDYFDRGRQPLQMMNYLNSIPNKVLAMGNHESLLLDCIKRGYPEGHDWHNGTAQTILDLDAYYTGNPMGSGTFEEACKIVEKPVKKFISQMVDYYKTSKYLFVHSGIPVNCEDDLPFYYTRNRKYSKMENWESASKEAWERARWMNPFDSAERGLLPDNLVTCFGHWHASYAWARADGRSEFGKDAKFDAFYGDNYISLDACTVHSGKVNIVVLEEDDING